MSNPSYSLSKDIQTLVLLLPQQAQPPGLPYGFLVQGDSLLLLSGFQPQALQSAYLFGTAQMPLTAHVGSFLSQFPR